MSRLFSWFEQGERDGLPQDSQRRTWMQYWMTVCRVVTTLNGVFPIAAGSDTMLQTPGMPVLCVWKNDVTLCGEMHSTFTPASLKLTYTCNTNKDHKMKKFLREPLQGELDIRNLESGWWAWASFTSRGSCTSLKPELSSTLRSTSRRGFFFGVDLFFARKPNIPCGTKTSATKPGHQRKLHFALSGGDNTMSHVFNPNATTLLISRLCT